MLSSVQYNHAGILGGTFVPCQAWTTAFYDTKVVGRANALVGGWGNSGGGFTFIIMVGLYDRLRRDGLSIHSAWRCARIHYLQLRDLRLTSVDSCFRNSACAHSHYRRNSNTRVRN